MIIYTLWRFTDVGHASLSKVFKRLSLLTSRQEIDAVLSSLRISQSNHVFPALPRTASEGRIIIREGEDGGVVTLAAYMIAKLASKETLKKRTGNKIIEMIRSLIRQILGPTGTSRLNQPLRKHLEDPFCSSTCGRKKTDLKLYSRGLIGSSSTNKQQN